MAINTDIQQLEPGELIELYELDCSEIGGDLLRFHGYAQLGPIWWQANEYSPWSIQATGFARTSQGQQPSPTLSVGNIGRDESDNPIPGVISSLCIHLDDLVGARLVRRRTLAKYLDAANFPGGNPTADPDEELAPEVWLVEQKTAENSQVVEFTLRTAIDFDDQQLPGRPIIASTCPWLWIGGYRGPYCAYTGNNYFDADDNSVQDPALDRCGGRLSSCKARFGEFQILNFGGFPAADRLR